MADPSERPGLVTAPGRCRHCGYDLTGTTADRCSECGSPVLVQLGPFLDPREAAATVAALRESGIAVHSVVSGAPPGGLGSWAGVETSIGVDAILLPRADLEKARRVLDDLGSGPPLPIVDRAEPICPGCGASLDPDASPLCADCGASFQWVRIEAEAGRDPIGSEQRLHPASRARRIVRALLPLLIVIVVALTALANAGRPLAMLAVIAAGLGLLLLLLTMRW